MTQRDEMGTNEEIACELSRWCSGGVNYFMGNSTEVMDAWQKRFKDALDSRDTLWKARMGELEKTIKLYQAINSKPPTQVELEQIISEQRAKLTDLESSLKRCGKALRALRASNGYGLDVPKHYSDGDEWIVKAEAIRKSKEALSDPEVKRVMGER